VGFDIGDQSDTSIFVYGALLASCSSNWRVGLNRSLDRDSGIRLDWSARGRALGHANRQNVTGQGYDNTDIVCHIGATKAALELHCSG